MDGIHIYGIDIGSINLCISHLYVEDRDVDGCQLIDWELFDIRETYSGDTRMKTHVHLVNALVKYLPKDVNERLQCRIFIEQQGTHWRHISFAIESICLLIGCPNVVIVSAKRKYNLIDDYIAGKMSYRERKRLAVKYINGRFQNRIGAKKCDDISDAILVALQGITDYFNL